MLTSTGRILFLIVAGLWVFVGVLTPPLSDRRVGPPMVFVSERTDTALYGAPPGQILESNAHLVLLRTTLFRVLAGLLVVGGLLIGALAWFGLAEPKAWVLATLTVVGLIGIPYWWMSLAPYRDAGIGLTLGDIPPLMWAPSILMPIASILVWFDYLRS